MTLHNLAVFSVPKPVREQEFNAWHFNVHLENCLWMPGYVSFQRYAVSGLTGQGKARDNLASYEIDDDDPPPVIAEHVRSAGPDFGATSDVVVSDAIDVAAVYGFAYAPVTAHMRP